jgi:prepilin-type N-terminal cleavage/methylation domain-containing protein
MVMPSAQPRKALTLIEVLAVVAIIAVLTGLLVPTIGWLRGSARQAACTSNLAQLGAATLIYSQLEGGRYPASQHWGASRTPEKSSAWFVQIPRLMQEGRIRRPGTIFQCPSFDGVPPGLIRHEVAKSYKMNQDIDRVRRGRTWRHEAFFVDRISDADQVVLFFDGVTSGGVGQWGYGGVGQLDDSRHAGWVAAVMADGRTVRVPSIDAARSPSGPLRWRSADW